MIKPGEIQNNAREVGVRDQQIEKDYILSWILQGIAQHELLLAALVFKGGTVLKKVYFQDYRFSEDLDFTLIANSISNEQIFSSFRAVFEYIRDEANIPLEIIDDNEHKDGGINFYISYVGPLGGSGAHKRVKIDISRSEKLEFEPVMQNVILAYSDQEEHELHCYSLEEVLVEKLRCTMQRMEARDLYDIWFLTEMHAMDIAFLSLEFRNKCKSKGVDPVKFHENLEKRLPQYKGRWAKSISSQINDLPDFDQVEREVLRQLKNLELE